MIRLIATSRPVLKIGTDIKTEDLRQLVEAKGSLHWDYCGLHGVLSAGVLANTWATLQDHLAAQRINGGRLKPPPTVFELHWKQTTPLEDPAPSRQLDSTGRSISPPPPGTSTASGPSSVLLS